MMCPPEGLAVTHAGYDLVSHRVLLTCKLPARTRKHLISKFFFSRLRGIRTHGTVVVFRAAPFSARQCERRCGATTRHFTWSGSLMVFKASHRAMRSTLIRACAGDVVSVLGVEAKLGCLGAPIRRQVIERSEILRDQVDRLLARDSGLDNRGARNASGRSRAT
jgi:hypothetical protein